MRDQLRIGSGLCWGVAWVLGLAAPAVYLLWPGDLTWWVAPLLAVPLVLLAVWRHEQLGSREDFSHGGDGGGTAWGPPGDGGGL